MTPDPLDREDRVRAAVRVLADAVPVDPPPAYELLRRAEARPARAWWRPGAGPVAWLAPGLAAAAVLAVLTVAAAAAPGLLAGPDRAQTADSGSPPALPSRLAGVSPVTAPVSAAPPGTAILAYGQGASAPRRLRLGQTVVLGRDGRTYRRVDEAERRGGPAEVGTWQDAPVLLSPDGNRVAVGSVGDVETVAVVDLRTGATRHYPARSRGPVDVLAWSPDGGRLGYLARGPDRGGFEILDLSTGGSTPVRVPPVPEAYEGGPAMAFSPDGRRVAVQADGLSPYEQAWDVWIEDLDGGPPRRLHTPMGTRLVPSAAWSPDGRWLAVTDNAAAGKRPGEVRFLDPDGRAAPPAPVGIPRATVTVLGWRSPTSLLLTEEEATDAPTLFEVRLGRAGEVREISRTEPGRLGLTTTYRMRAATALLPAAQVRPATDPARGPWPWWLRLYAAGVFLAGVGLVGAAGRAVAGVPGARRPRARQSDGDVRPEGPPRSGATGAAPWPGSPGS
jgi:hypothetical protein